MRSLGWWTGGGRWFLQRQQHLDSSPPAHHAEPPGVAPQFLVTAEAVLRVNKQEQGGHE